MLCNREGPRNGMSRAPHRKRCLGAVPCAQTVSKESAGTSHAPWHNLGRGKYALRNMVEQECSRYAPCAREFLEHERCFLRITS